ncbi:MAG: hypothetical protein V4510_06665 [bacterium]
MRGTLLLACAGLLVGTALVAPSANAAAIETETIIWEKWCYIGYDGQWVLCYDTDQNLCVLTECAHAPNAVASALKCANESVWQVLDGHLPVACV